MTSGDGSKSKAYSIVLDRIAALVDKSLLMQKEQADGELRFRLLEVVREYTLEILETNGETF